MCELKGETRWRKGKIEWITREKKRRENDIKTGFVLYGMRLKERNALTCSFKTNSIQLLSGGTFTLFSFFFSSSIPLLSLSSNHSSRITTSLRRAISIHMAPVVLWVGVCVWVGKVKNRLSASDDDKRWLLFFIISITWHRSLDWRCFFFPLFFHLAWKMERDFNGPSAMCRDSAPVCPIFIA